MKQLTLLALLLCASCQQAPLIITDTSFSRPVTADPGGSLAAPAGAAREALLTRVPDAHFADYAKQAELRRLLSRLDALSGELPDSSRRSAAQLARDNDVRGDGPSQFYSEEEALAQEEQYLSWSREQRIAFATQAMRALLASPLRPDDCFEQYRLHSLAHLDVEALRGAIGGYVGRTLMSKQDSRSNASEAQWLSRRNSMLAYKRLMGRLMLEDVAANRELPMGTRCAALECLRHIYTERALLSDGSNEGAFLVSALPSRGPLPTLLAMGDMRFQNYTVRAYEAQQLDALMKDAPRSAGLSPEKLLDHG